MKFSINFAANEANHATATALQVLDALQIDHADPATLEKPGTAFRRYIDQTDGRVRFPGGELFMNAEETARGRDYEVAMVLEESAVHLVLDMIVKFATIIAPLVIASVALRGAAKSFAGSICGQLKAIVDEYKAKFAPAHRYAVVHLVDPDVDVNDVVIVVSDELNRVARIREIDHLGASIPSYTRKKIQKTPFDRFSWMETYEQTNQMRNDLIHPASKKTQDEKAEQVSEYASEYAVVTSFDIKYDIWDVMLLERKDDVITVMTVKALGSASRSKEEYQETVQIDFGGNGTTWSSSLENTQKEFDVTVDDLEAELAATQHCPNLEFAQDPDAEVVNEEDDDPWM